MYSAEDRRGLDADLAREAADLVAEALGPGPRLREPAGDGWTVEWEDGPAGWPEAAVAALSGRLRAVSATVHGSHALGLQAAGWR